MELPRCKISLALARRFATVGVLVCAATAEDPTILHEASSVSWPMPAFSSRGSTQCDADGNLYFRTSLSLNQTGLLEVAADGSKYHFFNAPGGDADSKYYQFGEFNLARSGELRVLTYGGDSAAYVFLFRRDFSGASKTRLELPAHVHVSSFAAFESGAMLVAGFFTKAAEKESQGKTYTAVFAPSGKLKIVVGAHFGDVDLASVGKKLSEGGAAPGEDGFLYLLRPDEVVVISESGTIVRRIPIKKPSPDLLATRVLVSGGLAVVELLRDEGRGKPFREYLLLLNASSGERVGLYEPEPALGNNFLCFSRGVGFEFLTVRDDKVTVATAALQ